MIPPVSGNVRAVAGRRPLIVDVSNTNTIDTVELIASHADALVCKTTEGSGFVDSTYAAHRSIAAHRGIPFGGYLFLHPGSSGNEAEFFLEHAKIRRGDLQPWIDAEVRDGASFATVAARVDSCAKVLEQHGLQPLLYSYTGFLQGLLDARPALRRLRLVQASYTWRRPRVGRGATVVAWQYTDRLAAGSAHVDASRAFVPLDALKVAANV